MYISIPDKEPQSGNAIERFISHLLGLIRSNDRERLTKLRTPAFAHKSSVDNHVLIKHQDQWTIVTCATPEDQETLLTILGKQDVNILTFPEQDARWVSHLAITATREEEPK